VLNLFLQLDHLELPPDGQLLEPLELGQPLHLPVLMFGDLSLCLKLLGHVAGNGEHAQHLSAEVAMGRGVVLDLDEPLV
jgi:hypothetical protein